MLQCTKSNVKPVVIIRIITAHLGSDVPMIMLGTLLNAILKSSIVHSFPKL